MDFIKGHHLTKYKELIDQISCEYAKQEQLKKQIVEENNKIIALNLMYQNNVKQEKCFIKLKIFDSIVDIHNLYDDKIDNDILKNLSQYKNCKYYLFELYLQKSFYSNVVHSNWILNICIKSAQLQECKSVPIMKKLTYPICEIIPIVDVAQNSTVEGHLLLPSEDSYMYLHLNKVVVDISYNFESSNNICRASFHNRVFNLTKYYNYSEEYIDLKLIKSPHVIRYSFVCTQTKEDLMKICIKNSYHRLEIESFSNLFNSEDVSLQIYTGEDIKSTLIFNPKKGLLRIQAGVKEAHRMKQFFINELCNGTIILDITILQKLINLEYHIVHAEIPEDTKVKVVYKEIKNLFHQLPV